MNSHALYIASTPLIVLEAAGAALHRGEQAQLVLIEDFDLASRFASMLQRWYDVPFEAIHLIPGRYTEHQLGVSKSNRGIRQFVHRTRVKRAIHQQTLATLKEVDAKFQPDSVWVGNDRKVETQYALHLAEKRLHTRPGHYLDDGLHSYLGRIRQRPMVRRIDWLVKKLAYGGWGERVPQLGTSRWIAESWLAFPELAVDQDPGRVRRQLPREWFIGRPFQRLSSLAAREFRVDRAALRECSIVLVLPHSNLLRASPALTAALAEFIAKAGQRGERVALKYHPREVDADPAGLLAGAVNTLALPSLLPMELLLPLLPPGALLAGEASTALLAARWLRPGSRVIDLGISRNAYAMRACALFRSQGIPCAEGDLATL